jgi:hypothetical protein
MPLFAPIRSEKTGLEAVRRYVVSVIVQSEDENLQMKAVTFALMGGIVWRAGINRDDPGRERIQSYPFDHSRWSPFELHLQPEY